MDYYLDEETMESLPERVRLHIRNLEEQRIMLINQITKLMETIKGITNDKI